jgi:hypothetical protein
MGAGDEIAPRMEEEQEEEEEKEVTLTKIVGFGDGE